MWQSFGRMLAFLKHIDRPPLPAMANIGLIDDGSEITGEAMNLLARRNLLFRVVKAPDPKLDLNLKPTPEEAADPFAYAQKVRQKLGDEKRLVRLYGSDVVIGRPDWRRAQGAPASVQLQQPQSRRYAREGARRIYNRHGDRGRRREP